MLWMYLQGAYVVRGGGRTQSGNGARKRKTLHPTPWKPGPFEIVHAGGHTGPRYSCTSRRQPCNGTHAVPPPPTHTGSPDRAPPFRLPALPLAVGGPGSPVALAQAVQAELLGDFRRVHRVRQILLVRKHQQHRLAQFLLRPCTCAPPGSRVEQLQSGGPLAHRRSLPD